MAMNCDAVWRESSDYIDGTLAPDLRAAVEAHIENCPNCAVVLSGLRNIVALYGDERMAEVPAGFSRRLQRRLEASIPTARLGIFGWAYAVAASLLVAGAIGLSRSSSQDETPIRSKHARRAVKPLPPDLQVVVSKNGKLFHIAKCTFIHNRRTSQIMLASEAIQQGFTPCTRCLNNYL